MQLSAQLFADIVGEEVVAQAALAVPDERRQSPRANLGRRARIFPLMKRSQEEGDVVLVRDISVHGIGMLIAEPMSPGDEFVIHLQTANASSLEEPVQIHCAVRRCQAGGSGQTQFLVGSTFELVLNRPLDYAVEFPKDPSGDQQQIAPENSIDDQWDIPASSPLEERFDEQLAISMANRPKRWMIGEWLDQFLLTHWLGQQLRSWLAPVIDLMHRLGIRNRLALSSGELRRDDTKDAASAAGAGDVGSAEPAIPFRERQLITALDSASHYATNPEGIPETVITSYTSAASSSRRPSLFAHDQVIAPTSMTESIAAPAEALVESSSPAPPVAVAVELPPDAPPVVIPAFELPDVLPTETPATDQASEKSCVETVASASASETSNGLPLQPTLSAPTEIQEKPHHGAAWRARHRAGWSESTRNRPRLGR